VILEIIGGIFAIFKAIPALERMVEAYSQWYADWKRNQGKKRFQEALKESRRKRSVKRIKEEFRR
jgi:DNA gyrase inhibitor GyrI